MTVSELIAIIDSEMDNIRGTNSKVDDINLVEEKIFSNIIQEFYEDTQNLVSAQDNYTLTGYTFEDISKVYVNDVEYSKGIATAMQSNTFYKKNGGFYLYPVPSSNVTAGLVIMYKHKPTKKTVANIGTDVLSIPDQFRDAYKNYIFSQICIQNQEFDKANNYIALYNAIIEELRSWYQKQQGMIQRKVW